MRWLLIFFAYFGQYVKRQMSYRFNFIMQGGALVGWGIVNLSLIHLVFQQVPSIQGWSYAEALLIYGLAHAAFGLSFVFGANLLWLPSRYIVEGHLDRVLIRPLNPYLQMLFEEFSAEDLLFTVMGFAVVRYALGLLGHPFDLPTFALLVLMVLSASLAWIGMLTIAGSCSFWFKDRGTLIWPLIETADQVGRYPLTIYPTGMRWILTGLIPIGFLGFFPAQAFLGRPEWAWSVWMTPVMGVGLALAGYAMFRLGLRTYESAGS